MLTLQIVKNAEGLYVNIFFLLFFGFSFVIFKAWIQLS